MSLSRLGSAITLSTAGAVLFGMAEWAILAAFGIGLGQAEAGRVIALLLLLYGGFGLFVGLVLPWLFTGPRWRAAAVAIPPALLLGLRTVSVGRGVLENLAAAGVALAVAWASYRILLWLTGSVRLLEQPQSWWTFLGLLLGASLLALAAAATDRTGVIAAVAGAIAVFSLLLLAALQRRNRTKVPLALHVTALLLAAVAVTALGSRTPRRESSHPGAPDGPSVLLVTIDTLRADHVGAYGYPHARTPNLDGLAQRGVLFRQAVTSHIFTAPSHASILTGLLPQNHGVWTNNVDLPSSIPTLAKSLGDRGYATAAFISGYTLIDQSVGLPSRFQFHDDQIQGLRGIPRSAYRPVLGKLLKKIAEVRGVDFERSYRPAKETADAAVAWLDKNGSRPFLMWLHFFDPHLPYQAPSEYLKEEDRQYAGSVTGEWYGIKADRKTEIISSPSSVQRMIDLYDAEISYADEQMGRVVERARGLAADRGLLIAAMSDHGESMGEHDLFWSRDLFDDTLLVPLIIVPSTTESKAPRVVEEQVRLIDVAPTILDLVGIRPPGPMDGSSLAGLIRDGEPGVEGRPALSLATHAPSSFLRRRLAIRDRGWKLIWRAPGWAGQGGVRWLDATEEAYHLRGDPEELHPVQLPPDVALRLGVLLDPHKSATPEDEISLSVEERKALKALGYVQ